MTRQILVSTRTVNNVSWDQLQPSSDPLKALAGVLLMERQMEKKQWGKRIDSEGRAQ